MPYSTPFNVSAIIFTVQETPVIVTDLTNYKAKTHKQMNKTKIKNKTINLTKTKLLSKNQKKDKQKH